jgi:hypothetical protein
MPPKTRAPNQTPAKPRVPSPKARATTSKTAIPLRSIGVVRSPVNEGRDGDWGHVVAELHLDPAFARGLLGLDAFSHALVSSGGAIAPAPPPAAPPAEPR